MMNVVSYHDVTVRSSHQWDRQGHPDSPNWFYCVLVARFISTNMKRPDVFLQRIFFSFLFFFLI